MNVNALAAAAKPGPESEPSGPANVPSMAHLCAFMAGNREESLRRAVDDHDWATAQGLATTDEELQLVEDSMRRVEAVKALISEGSFVEARELAVSAKDKEMVDEEEALEAALQ